MTISTSFSSYFLKLQILPYSWAFLALNQALWRTSLTQHTTCTNQLLSDFATFSLGEAIFLLMAFIIAGLSERQFLILFFQIFERGNTIQFAIILVRFKMHF